MIEIESITNTIINDDCMNILKQLPDKCIDLVLTDPPYIIDMNGGKGKAFGDRKLIKDKHIDFIAHDFDWENVFNEFIRVCKKVNLCIFCSNAQISRTMKFFEDKGYKVTLCVWDKPNPIPLCNMKLVNNLEFIVWVKEDKTPFNNELEVQDKLRSFKYPAPQERIHPTEKPIKLIRHLVNLFSNKNDLVLDCFSGSGTTAVACHNLKRRFICIEKDYDYWKASVERLENAKAQLKLF